jgi:LysM repeat protein
VVVVAEGETLQQIAKRWGTDVNTLMMLNNLVSERVTTGQTLRLPPAAAKR